jgi:hypothetical protein
MGVVLTGLIIVVAIFLIVLFIRILLRENYIINANPLSTLAYNECLGFRLRDSCGMVESRMNHLRLVNEQKLKNQSQYNFTNNNNDGVLTVPCRGKYNNIDSINFIFNDDTLESILVKFWPEQSEINIIINLSSKLAQSRIGRPKDMRIDKDDNVVYAYWESGDSAIKLENNGENSCLFIASRG